MVVRIGRILSATVALALMAQVRPADGWSLNPFSSPEPKSTTVKKPVSKKEPSTFDKIGAGTKSFFNKTGETLGLKKPESKRATYATARPPKLQPRSKPKSSWLPFMQPEEPKHENVADWMSKNERPTFN